MLEKTVALSLFLPLCLGIVGLGSRLLRKGRLWPGLSSLPDAGMAAAAGLSALILALFALGAAHLLTPLSARALAVAVLAAGIPELLRFPARTLLRRWPLPRGLAPRICAAALLGLLAIQLLDGTNFPTGADVVRYHFPIVKEMIERRSLEPAPYLYESCALPQNVHLLFAFGALVYNDLLGKMFLWLFASSAALILFGLARRLFGITAAWAAVFIFSFTPWTNYNVHIPLVEGGLALFLVAAADAFLRGRPEGERAWWLLSAVFVGIALGIKQSALAAVPIFFGFVAWEYGWKVGISGMLRAVALAALACLAGSLWYLRNWYYLGNPIWPLFFGGAWVGPPEFVPSVMSPGAGLEPIAYFMKTLVLSYGPDCFSFYHPGLAIFGPVVLALAFGDRRLAAFSVLGCGSLAFNFATASFSSRYWFPYYAVVCAALGAAFAWAVRKRALRHPAWALLVGMAFATVAYEALAAAQLARLVDRAAFESTCEPPREICAFCEEHARPEKEIFVAAATNLYFRRPAAVADLRQSWLLLIGDADDLLDRLRGRDIDILLLDRRYGLSGRPGVAEAFRRRVAALAARGDLTVLLDRDPYAVYRVGPR